MVRSGLCICDFSLHRKGVRLDFIYLGRESPDLLLFKVTIRLFLRQVVAVSLLIISQLGLKFFDFLL